MPLLTRKAGRLGIVAELWRDNCDWDRLDPAIHVMPSWNYMQFIIIYIVILIADHTIADVENYPWLLMITQYCFHQTAHLLHQNWCRQENSWKVQKTSQMRSRNILCGSWITPFYKRIRAEQGKRRIIQSIFLFFCFPTFQLFSSILTQLSWNTPGFLAALVWTLIFLGVSEHILTKWFDEPCQLTIKFWVPNRFHDAERRIAWALEKDTVAPSFHRVDWDGMIALV